MWVRVTNSAKERKNECFWQLRLVLVGEESKKKKRLFQERRRGESWD